MSDTNGARPPAPGGFRSDPDPAARPEGHSLDSALEELQRRRKRRPPRRAAPPEPAAVAEPEPAAEPELREPQARREPDGELPGPAAWRDEAAPGEPARAEGDETTHEAGEAAEPPVEGHFTVTLDGQPRQVPVSELIAGYMRSADYSKKTQQTAQQQQQFADAFQTFTRAREQLEQRLQRFTTDAGREFEQPIDWVKLAQTDPIGWAEKRARYDAIKEAEAEQSRLTQLRQAEDNARKAEMLQLGHQVLVKALPGWKEPGTRTKLQGEMKEFAASVGYTQQELAADILDPRQLIILHDAMMYRRMQSRRVTPQPPERQPTMDRGGATTPTQPTRRQQEAERDFSAEPSVDNAMALLKARQSRRPPRVN